MLSNLLVALALTASAANAHSIFHRALINGVDQGQHFGVRAPSSNSPIEDVNSQSIVCNTGLKSPVSTDVLEVNPGDEFGMQWNHEGGDWKNGDSDEPIAASHKGPMMAYMAKVDDASTNDGSGLKWFKVAEEGLDITTGKWGVDTLIENKGLWSFKIPNLAPGDYLLRGELLALHSAGNVNGAQFYMSCAGIRVGGSGTCSPSETVSFPGAYSPQDPGILISIYGNTGTPDNGRKPYTIPGPSVISCSSSGSNPTHGGSSASTSKAAPASSSSCTGVAPIATTSTAAGVTSSATSKPSGHGHHYGSTLSNLPSTFVTSKRPRPSKSEVNPAKTSSASTTACSGQTPVNPIPTSSSVPTSTSPVAPATTTASSTYKPVEWEDYTAPAPAPGPSTTAVSGNGSNPPPPPPADSGNGKGDGTRPGRGKPIRMVCIEEPDEEGDDKE